jgi:hypothetical protein
MKSSLIFTVAVGMLSLIGSVGCSSNARPGVPTSAAARTEPEVMLVWVGHSTAQRLEGGSWKRVPEFDYEFTVVQRRYHDHWESTKDMHRRHPGYDLSAGPRDQTYSFSINYAPAAPDGKVSGSIWSTLGDGQITTDHEFRKGQIEIAADVSSFAPFNTYRITQDYRYETGELREVVELLKKKPEGEQQWVRNDEEAKLFAVRKFDAPPTSR